MLYNNIATYIFSQAIHYEITVIKKTLNIEMSAREFFELEYYMYTYVLINIWKKNIY